MISADRKAQVCDYGLSPITSNPSFIIAVPTDSFRRLAPEIIDPPDSASSNFVIASKPADVFAFAMLVVEVFSGEVPFSNTEGGSVVTHIVNGKRPARPRAAEQLGLTVKMWRFVEKCWDANPNKRPTIDEVVHSWEGFVNRYVVSASGPCTN